MVHRNQDVGQVLKNVRQNNFGGENNITNVVEQILAQNDLNIGLHMLDYISPFLEYVQQTKLPNGWKVPKFTKFFGEANESIVEHVARYQTGAGDITNNENLKMKYFPNSLTKKYFFMWFTTPSPHNSIHNWNQLKIMFHEQFDMGQSKISLKELVRVKHKML